MNVESKIKRQVQLADYAAYRVGGKADYFFEAESEIDLIAALEWASSQNIPYFIMGAGSNLLIRDGGYRGLVVYLGPKTRTWKIETLEQEHCFRVPSAFSKAELLDFALAHAYAGLEFSAGIPGSMGGAVYMNAGTRWGSYASVIESVRLWAPDQGVFEKSVSQMGFKYRGHGEGSLSQGTVVLSVDIRLRPTLDKAAQSLAIVDRILSYRGSRQALERPSCGSVFKNPENSKMGAGRLIEAAQLKGHKIGGAQVSTKHANFILNAGCAKACDIEDLIKYIQSKVQDQFQILLEPEVIFLGENI